MRVAQVPESSELAELDRTEGGVDFFIRWSRALRATEGS